MKNADNLKDVADLAIDNEVARLEDPPNSVRDVVTTRPQVDDSDARSEIGPWLGADALRIGEEFVDCSVDQFFVAVANGLAETLYRPFEDVIDVCLDDSCECRLG